MDANEGREYAKAQLLSSLDDHQSQTEDIWRERARMRAAEWAVIFAALSVKERKTNGY